MSSGEHLVEVEDLSVRLAASQSDRQARGGEWGSTAPILDSVSFAVAPGKMTALVGESGAGKSMTTKAILGLLDERVFQVSGRMVVAGQDVSAMRARARRRYTSGVMSLVFQNPAKALNPTMHVGPQIAEALRFSAAGQHLSAKQAHGRAVDLMRQVGIAAPEERYHAYPHQMSGGMQQRAVIAIALSMNPRVLLADEPTSSLDVTTQALIMDLLDELRARLGIGILFITHDLVLAASRADDVLVLHSGRLVETMPVRDIFAAAAMPYTRDLIARVPGVGQPASPPDAPAPPPPSGPLAPLAPSSGPPACRYAAQCGHRQEICTERVPPLAPVAPGHLVRCWFPVGHEPLDPSAEPDAGAVGTAPDRKPAADAARKGA